MIDEKKTFQKFFSLGFFPEELPPEFGPYGISEEIAEDLWDRIEELRSVSGDQERKPSEPTSISFPKSEFVRRNFHFLNPLYFARLSHTILTNWQEITEHTEQSKFSTSRLVLSDSKKQIFKHDPFSKSIDQRINRSASKEYVLYVDIENFYPSIYTHTIDWAFNGGVPRHYSEHNKREHVGVALDKDVHRSQGNITSGIVIGPVTSRIISEIISSHFDHIISSEFDSITGTRYVDDYHLFVSSKEEIENVQIVLQKVLSNFKLKFNEAKIQIDSLPEVYSDYWTKYFDNKEQLIRDNRLDKKEAVRRFSKAFELIKKDTKNPSLRYFFRVLEDKSIIQHFELSMLLELIHHSVKIDPRSISRACIAMLEGELIDQEIHDNLVHFEPTLIKCSNLGYEFEVLWMLYLFLHAGRIIPEVVVDNAISNFNIVVIAYLLKCR
ncbi:MAG: RNA-directed DNA polymerase, partial [Candidatus Paceibacterota bacterium]